MDIPEKYSIPIRVLFPLSTFALLPDGKLIIYTNDEPPSSGIYNIQYTVEETYNGTVIAESEKIALEKARDEEWETEPESEGDAYPESDTYEVTEIKN